MSSEPSAIELIQESLTLEQAGEIPTALRKAKQALQVARHLNAVEITAQALVCLARLRFHLGQYSAAQALAEEALTLAPAESPTYVEALLRSGACIAIIGTPLAAEQRFWHAANLARESGYPALQISALHDLAANYMLRGCFELALATDEEAYQQATRHEIQEWLAPPLILSAWISLLTRQIERATKAVSQLEHISPPHSVYQGYTLCLAAYLALDEGDKNKARMLFTQTRTLAEDFGEAWINTMMRIGMSRYHRLMGDSAAACAWADDAVSYATRANYRHARGMALIERGRAHWSGKDLESAEADFGAAIETLTPMSAAFELAHAWLLCAVLRFERNAPSSETHAAWLEAVSRIMTGGYAFLLEQERSLTFPLLSTLLSSPDRQVASVSERLLENLVCVSPPPLRIITLGTFEVWQGQRWIERRVLRRRRSGELLALLLLHPVATIHEVQSYTCTFDEVAEALWSSKEPTAAQTAFHHTTSALRRALEPDLPDKFPSRYLEVEEGQITLYLPEGSSVDFETFERQCQCGEIAAALSLYHGPLLPDWLYADWTAACRQRLGFLYQQALLAAATERLQNGHPLEALKLCQQVLGIEPWHEQAVLLGMQACIALKDRAGARRLYLNLTQTLQNDLQVAPSEELRMLYRSL